MIAEILRKTRERVEFAKKERPLGPLLHSDQGKRDFARAIKGKETLKLIAEIKPASPSTGMLRGNFSAESLAREMESAGASALSVLTEPYFFKGSLDNLVKAKSSVSIPVLRKDFIIDDYQVFESAAFGADAILLIVGLLTREKYRSLLSLAGKNQLDVISEVHTEEELKTALSCGANVIGINNRDLKTLEIDSSTTLRLIGTVPKSKIIVSESGFSVRADADRVRGKADAILVGSSIMKADDISAKVRELIG